MRLLIPFLLLIATPPCAEEVLFPAPSGTAGTEIVIYSSLDAALVRPLIAAYQAGHPATAIRYDDLLTGDLANRITDETDAGLHTADLAISSAMDLQVKLANDGYASPVEIAEAEGWPRWANWRDTAFAFTLEPAVIVYHRPAFPDGPPLDRAALVDWLAATGPGRIGTYDIARAAVGYLFLARDQEHFADIWTLVAAMGRAGVRLYPTSREIIDRVSSGELLIGYNILGSYAAEQAGDLPDLGIALPRDYVVAVSRVAIVPRAAANPGGGADFLAFLLSPEGQEILSRDLHLPGLSPAVTGPGSASALIAEAGDRLRPVPVSPGLLAYIDQSRRERFLERWSGALAPAGD